MTKPIKVHLTPPGPNAWKVIFVLEELGVPYEIKCIHFSELKSEAFTAINPNGRVPAIEDPNTGIVLWESASIILYIVEQYDTEKTLTYTDLKQRHLLNQWLAFQVSGQGPYYGQASWFHNLHSETVPSAISRYDNEVQRILGVLNGVLEGKDWLVGPKMTFADLVFAPYNDFLDKLIHCAPNARFKGFPNVEAWHKRVTSRPSWLKSMQIRTRLMEEQSHLPTSMAKGISNMDENEAKIKVDAEDAATTAAASAK